MSLFADRSKVEKRLFSMLSNIPGFTDFANIKGALAGMNAPASTSAAGLQTMDATMAQLEVAAKAQGLETKDVLNPANFGSKNLDNSKEEIATGNKRIEAENFQALKPDSIAYQGPKTKDKKPDSINALKTKRYVDRLTYGSNLQVCPHTTVFPTTGTIAAQVAYQITTEMNLGFGASYLLGFQKPTAASESQPIPFMNSNGYNLRSYYDCKLRGNLYLQANYELNYRKTIAETAAAFPTPFPLGRAGDGKESFLLGLKAKTPSTKRTQKTMEILYDFMHDRTGQPALVVRMGMEFLPKHGYRK